MVYRLLRLNDLPYLDIRIEMSLFNIYHDDANSVVGVGGLEFYGDYALMRSVVVDANYRQLSYGSKIVNDLLEKAKARNVKDLFLLTETAREFFLKHGFRDLPRDKVPLEIQASSEFSTVCPLSAAVMARSVG